MLNLLKLWLLSPLIHQRLFRNFVKQEFTGRYVGSIGGAFWLLITPAANIMIYVFIFSYILNVKLQIDVVGTDQFVIFLLTALFPWMAFSEALSRSTNLLVEQSSLITKVSFPVQILPMIATATPFLINGVGFVLFLGYLGYAGFLSINWFWLPLIIGLQVMFTAGLVAIISALAVFMRDLQQIVGLALSVWFYATPIIYPVYILPEKGQQFLMLNPMFSFVELYRAVLLQEALPLVHLIPAASVSVICFFFGGWLFMRIKHAFGDVL